MGTQQIWSVPYALYSEKSGNGVSQIINTGGNVTFNLENGETFTVPLDGADGNDGISINWLGTYTTAPASPALNDGYYNSTDGVSYIWNGTAWQIVAQDGNDGAIGAAGPQGPQGPIGNTGPTGVQATHTLRTNDLGTYTTAPTSPALNDSYYNSTDGVSYIWNGTAWQIVAQDGTDGAMGAAGPQGPQGPIGNTGPAGTPGTNRVSINWLGTYTTAPTSPALNDSYYNSTDGVSYIWNGTAWQIVAQDGTDGAMGAAGPQGPQGPIGNTGPAGTPGTNGVSINWLGTHTTAPASPALNDGYYNSTDGVSYVWNGTAWQIVAQDGTDGAIGAAGPQGPQGPIGNTGPAGAPGTNGISINWLGTYTTAPASPALNDSYYNSTDGVSYIWNGTAWQIVAQDGTDGIAGTNGLPGADGINMEWLGDFSNAPASPTLNQAYYNTTDGESYIWDGSAWQTVAKDGVGAGGPHNTLNQAYNEGGAGAGRVITANSGPVEINQTTSGTRALVVTTDAGSNASISIDAINNGTGLSIRGTNTNPSNTNATIQAESNTSNTNTSAILGQNLGAGYGVTGQIPATASGAAAVYGNNLSSTNNGIGVKGIGTLNGVEGETNNISGTGVIGANHGVFQGGATTNGIGTAGIGGIGIFGQAGGYGVNLAAYFSGNINVAGQGIATLGFFTASDERLKSEITPISNALERISNLSGYHYLFHSKVYDLKNDKTTESVSKQYGVIAQEVEKEFPEMVTNKAYFKTAGDDTEYKSVNYNELVPVLIEAIKELNDKVDTNQTEIEILKQKIKILESK